MSFEEEWGRAKAGASDRSAQASTRLNQAGAGSGATGSAPSGDGFHANTASINGNAHLLMEIAGLLYAGRMDGDNATAPRSPRAHADVAAAVLDFATFAKDQYNDTVALLAGLSTKLESSGNAYTEIDEAARAQLSALVECGVYRKPKDVVA
ncbi:hypothetical protein [Streptomyces sp. NPDC090022]|uniref:hypothetical protein n=1 Tax=Streptomyces sp. NPDC090022 TaxID=3365920 RepID=UPI00383009C7